MGLVDFVIDVAAVIKASRSVASKHAALRGRQLNAYGLGSRLAPNLASRAAQGPSRPQAAARPTGEVERGRDDHAAAGETSSGGKANPGPLASAESISTEARTNDRPSPSPFIKGDTSLGSRLDTTNPAAQPTKTDGSDQIDAPPGVDVGVFFTNKGSSILKSLHSKDGTQQNHGPSGASAQGASRPVKEHPMRYWPRPPPVQVEATTPHVSAPPQLQTEEALQSEEAQPLASSIPTPVERVPSQTIDEPVPSEATPPASSSDATSPPAPFSPSARVHQLRESKVPATRFSRLVNYGGLAAGLLGGAMTEGLSRALGGGGQGSVLLSEANTERLVAKLSKMRGAALKIGQMMSFQDSKMLPAPIREVLQRVQDRADYMPAWQRDRVLSSNLGSNWRDIFSEFEEKPIAAASIGQVHKAVLKSNGRRVAVKIQFPGVADSINSDLDNIGILLTATRLLPKGLYLNKTIDNARLELGWECDYERELDCARRYREILQGEEEDIFLVPDVYPEASGKQVLTMDFLDGIGVTRVKSFTQEQRDWIGTQLFRLCLREITEFRFMQTDPNWTNFLYNAETNKLELLDFGASREYPEEFVKPYVQLLDAASRSDRQGLQKFSQDLGYLTGHESKMMLDAHIQSIQTIAEPFLASAPELYDFKGQTITERVKALIPVMLRERLTPPPEETYSLHRKLSGAFLLCARLESKVPCRKLFLETVAKSGYVQAS